MDGTVSGVIMERYQIGQKVLYGSHGVCVMVGREERIVDRKPVTYYVLEPMGQGSSRFLVPSHNVVAMGKLRPVLTRQELEALLGMEAIRFDAWIREENLRKQTYRELLSSGDRMRLLTMLHTLYRHKSEQLAAGKKVHLCDENFLRDGEKLLASEISFVLDLCAEEAKQYLRDHLLAE